MRSKKSPTAARRQGFDDGMVVQAVSDIEASALTLEMQRHSAIDWLAARANVALPTARLFAELHGFAGCRG